MRQRLGTGVVLRLTFKKARVALIRLTVERSKLLLNAGCLKVIKPVSGRLW